VLQTVDQSQVAGATRMVVDSEAVARDLVERAARARATDATAMNAVSSRSHSVFTLHITGVHEGSGCRLLGSLNLVDLAGSERLARSQAEGQRQKETCAINKSLSSLGDIFSVRFPLPLRHSPLSVVPPPLLFSPFCVQDPDTDPSAL
jgi:kinesin family member C1